MNSMSDAVMRNMRKVSECSIESTAEGEDSF